MTTFPTVVANILAMTQEEKRRINALRGPKGNTYGDGFDDGVVDFCNRLEVFIAEELGSSNS